MSDLTKLLRQRAESIRRALLQERTNLYDEAADRIEYLETEMPKRLRQQGEAWAADAKHKDAHIEQLVLRLAGAEAEIARLNLVIDARTERAERAERERDSAREYGTQARIRENRAEDKRIHEHDRAERAEREAAELRELAGEASRAIKRVLEGRPRLGLDELIAQLDAAKEGK